MNPTFILALVTFCVAIDNAFGQNCVDLSNCAQWPDSYCQTYYDYMKKNCPIKCSYCQGPTIPPVCEDVKPQYCPSWKQNGYCESSHKYHSYMKVNCKNTCGFCGSPPATPKPTQPGTSKPTGTSSCSASKKLSSCSFGSDTCDFIDVPFDDDLDFAMRSSGGQDGQGYISASGRGLAQMILPLELLVPHNGDHGNMCMEFYYRISSQGSLVLYEVKNTKNYPKNTQVRLSGQQSVWKKSRITFRAAQTNHLLIEASPNSGSVDIDSVRFCDGSCIN